MRGGRAEAGLAEVARAEAAGSALVVAGRSQPGSSGLGLADLSSRLAAGTAYRLQPINDRQRREALQIRANELGFELSDEVAGYILQHLPRDTHWLFSLLERLDHSTLAAQRRVSIPFIKALLGDG